MEIDVGTSVDILGRDGETNVEPTHEENIQADYDFLVVEHHSKHLVAPLNPSILEMDY